MHLIFRTLNNTARVAKNAVSDEVVRILNEGGQFPDMQPLVSGARGHKVFEDGDLDAGIWTVGQVQGIIRDIPTAGEVLDARLPRRTIFCSNVSDSSRNRTTSRQNPSLRWRVLWFSSGMVGIERETLGHLFESQVFHDVAIYAQQAGARGVFHYRDVKGRDEIDIVVEGANGEWLAIEAILGAGSVDEAAAQLDRVSSKIHRPPMHQIVVVPVGVAHRREDGVLVVPLTTLGP